MTNKQISLEIALGLLLTVIAITLNWLLMGPVVKGLNFGLFVSFIAWLIAYPVAHPIKPRIFPLFAAAIAVQTFHFLEEYATAFYTAFPGIYGESWTSAQFATFNVVWLVVLIVAAVGVRKNVRLALLAVWFLALVGGIGNGLLHAWLSYRNGGYFPGALTSLLAFPVGIALVVMLVRKTKKNSEFQI
ncbi:MAG: HXXEE domain-containing protein [bacterium]